MRRTTSPVQLKLLVSLVLGISVGLPLWAERPPAGYARPPIHVKGNATTGPTGYTPAQITTAYGLAGIANKGAGITIAIVDAYDDPNISSDLSTFKKTFGITGCNFSKVYANGSQPAKNAGWDLEISLDVEWACAIAPQANIVLVEAASNSFTNLLAAVDVAVQQGAQVISMSWGGGESSSETGSDAHFNVSSACFTASSGDSGSGVEYPAASPYVVAVGGTTLNIQSNGTYVSESAWSGSGGGQSVYESEPSYQSSVQTSGTRGVPDVAYDANPSTGVPVYDTVRYQGQSGWFKVGGTSVGAPSWAAIIAIADSSRVAAGKPVLTSASFNSDTDLYDLTASWSSNYHDITSGSNGSCGAVCSAGPGYDYITGVGSPLANNLIPALVNLP